MSTNVGQINYVVNLDTSKALASIETLQKEANKLRSILGKPFVMKAKVDSTAFQSLTQQAQNVGKELQKSVSKPLKTQIRVDNSDLAYTQKLFNNFKNSAKSGGVFSPQVDNKRLLVGLNAMENQIKHFKDKAEIPIQVQTNAKNLTALDNELKKVGKSLPELKQALAKGITLDKFFNDAKMLQNETQRIQARWTKMSGAITNGTERMINSFTRFSAIVAKFTISAGVGGFVALLAKGVDNARNIQDSLSALHNANVFEEFSTSSQQLIKDWAELNSKVGKFDANGVLKEGARYASISQADYVEGAEKISLYLKNFQMSDQERVSAIKDFNALTADMSSFWNKDVSDLQDTLIRYMSGRPQALNMLVKGYENFNIPALNSMAEELYGKSFSKLDFAEQKVIRMKYLFQSMGITFDDNSKTLYEFNTRIRQMKNDFSDVATGIGQLLLPTLNKMFDGPSEKLNGFAQKIRELLANPEAMAQASQQVEQFIFGKVIPMIKRVGAIIGPLMLGSTFLKITGLSGAFAKQMPNIISTVGKGGLDLGNKLVGGITTKLTTLSTTMPGLMGTITSSLASGFGSIGGVLGGVGASVSTLGIGLALLPIIIATVGGAFQGLFGTIRQLPTIIEQNAGEGAFGKLNESINGIKTNFMSMLDGIWGILQQFFGGIWGVGQSIGGAIGKVFGAIMLGLGPIIQFFTTIWNFVIRFIEKIGIIEIFFNNIKIFFTTIGNTLSAFLMPIFQAIGDVFRDHIMPAIQPIIDKAMEFAPKVRAFFEWLQGIWTQYISPTLEWFAGFIGDTIAPIISTVGSVIGGVISSVVGWLSGLWDKISWVWNKVSGFFEGIKSGWDTMISGIKGAFENFVDGIKNLWNTIIDWINKGIDIANMIPGVNIGKLPTWKSQEQIESDSSSALQRHLAIANEINGRMAGARNNLFTTQRDLMKAKSNGIIINIDNSNSVIPEKFADEIINSTMTTLGGAYGLVR